jgi:hypothetical protein
MNLLANNFPQLTVQAVVDRAILFSEYESRHDEPSLYGVTDGKAIGTYLEHKFVAHLMESYSFAGGNSASGIDIPSVNIDIKVTSVRQPQSSCPFRDARQKVYGLGYHIIVFVYEKIDDPVNRTGRLNMRHTIFIDQGRTADYQTTTGLRNILRNNGNIPDLVAFLQERNLPVDEIGAFRLAEEIMQHPPEAGYLTISNALQWRLQYQRVIDCAGEVIGLIKVR